MVLFYHKQTLNLVFLAILLSQTVCYVQKESFVTEVNSGSWSDPITAIHDQWHEPTQHFLCGYAVRQMKWTKLLNNCNCGYKIGFLKLSNYKCDWCENTFWSMRNAFKTIYCGVNDWLNQVTKVVETGHTESRNWKQFKCPKGFYVKQAAARLGAEQQTFLGFTGMQMVCSNLEQDKTQKIDDNSNLPLEDLSQNAPGTFVSAVRIKYEKNGKLTGIRWIFEGIAEIKQAQIKYGQIVGKSTRRVIQTTQIVNNGKQGKKIKVNLSNNYTTTHTWTNKNPYFSAYSISNSLQVKPPQLDLDKDQGLYTITRSKFGFDTPLTNKYLPTTSLSTSSFVFVPVPASTNFTATTVVDEMIATVLYEMKVKFYDRTSGEFIIEKKFEGTYSGVVESPITMSLEHNQCISLWSKTNLIINGDFEQNSCTLPVNWCNWNQVSIKGNLPGWIPSPSIEIGRGNIYNPMLGNSWVSELDTESNTCIKQKVKLGNGKYSLSFDRTARVDVSLQSNQMQVRFNGTVLRKIYPENYFLQRESIEILLSQNTKDYWLEFCGAGRSDGLGIVIDNVQLLQFSECGVINTMKY